MGNAAGATDLAGAVASVLPESSHDAHAILPAVVHREQPRECAEILLGKMRGILDAVCIAGDVRRMEVCTRGDVVRV